MPPRHATLSLLVAIWLAAAVAGQAPAPGEPPREITAEEAGQQRAKYLRESALAYKARDWPAVEAALRELIPLDADNFVHWYNLACALSLQGKTDEAVTMLEQAIARGFADLRRLSTDPDLANIRETEGYRAIVAGWDRFLDRRIEAALDAARERFGKGGSPYVFEKDDALRLAYVSGFDPVLFDQAKGEIAQLTRWWETYVLPAEEPLRSGLDPNRGADRPDPWVVLVLPTRADYVAWAVQTYGESWERVGGQYHHDRKQLVTQDLGSGLRHEYWHALHWRHMDQLGQRHPYWVMEGLCSLVEDVAPAGSPDVPLVALPSWRTNIVKRLAKAGRLVPLDVLLSLDGRRFMTSRPQAMYAQSRALFMYLLDQGKLRDWYTAYVRGYATDPTGAAAFEEVFGKPLAEVAKDFRDWMLEMPEVVETLDGAPCDLPVRVDPEACQGDGVPVAIGPMSSQARKAGLKARDVITALDGQPIRDVADLARILGGCTPGQEVELSLRRGREHLDVSVRLLPPTSP